MSLRKAGTVYLIDRSHEDPYSLKSAPIHKLMIAHAREVHKIIYRRGSPKKKGNVISFAEYEFPASELRIVVRHGPQPSFGHLISKTQAEELKRRQEAISDFSAAPRWSEPYPAPSGLPQRDLDDGEFIESRLALVRRAIRTIDENAEVTRQTRRIRVDYDRVVPAHAPAQLFGIPLVNEVERTVKPIS
jgi:hypothetical protein